MKKLLILTVTALLVFAFAFTAYAETKTTVTGQIRSRGEGVQKSFNADNEHIQTFGYLRTRINIKSIVDKNAMAFVQLQDTRMYGKTGQSGTLSSSANVDIHQAYLKYNLWTKENWSIGTKAGRFEYVCGNQRLLGSVGWHNVGRSWEGGLAWYDAEKFSVTLGGLKKLENSDTGYDGDFDVFLFAVKLKEVGLDLLVFAEDNKDTTALIASYNPSLADDYTASAIQDIQMLKRVTLAAFYKRKVDKLDMEFNFAIQTGTEADIPIMPGGFNSATDTIEIETEFDISAMMFTGEVGYSFEGERNARVAFGIDYASGTDLSDTTNTDIKTFNNLYWTSHKFNGHMDYFLGGGPNGLMDIMLRGKVDITKGWIVGADLHLFSAAEEYSFDSDTSVAVTTMATSKDIGTEIDIFVKTNRVKGVALQWGMSMFSAKDDYAIFKENTTDLQSGTWFYSQATMNF